MTPSRYYATAALAAAVLAGIGGVSLSGANCSGLDGYCSLDFLGWFGVIFLPAGLLWTSVFSFLWATDSVRSVRTTQR